MSNPLISDELLTWVEDKLDQIFEYGNSSAADDLFEEMYEYLPQLCAEVRRLQNGE
jgi:hypothetical protein